MSSKQNYDLSLEALEETAAEQAEKQAAMDGTKQTRPQPARPTLQKVIAAFSPLPADALFLGVAYDELPILLNLRDPSPGPLLLASEAGGGKTQFLQTIAQTCILAHQTDSVQFGVVTNYPDEWQDFVQSPHCIGVFPTYQNKMSNFVTSLSEWAHSKRGNGCTTLLLLDDLESLIQTDAEVQQALRWLLLRGPNRQVWPIVTLNAGRAAQVAPWLDAFRTRLFGRIKNIRRTGALIPTSGAEPDTLEAALEFQMREGKHWVRFWIPSIQ
ncbi:MAG: hypothetical protein L3J16_02795 [Anaerolineales bacterium]|nr:hypothetical protein [Anaerolineales bacterium]